MKYIPVAVLAVSLITGYVTLQNRVANAEKKIKSSEVEQSKLSADTSDIKVSQARTEEKIGAVLEMLKGMKENHG